jgi:hypothetical protein
VENSYTFPDVAAVTGQDIIDLVAIFALEVNAVHPVVLSGMSMIGSKLRPDCHFFGPLE